MPTYPFPRIKLAESEQDEGNLNFFERHPKKLLAAGGVLGGLAVHRLLKGKGMAGSYKSNSGPKGGASAGGGRPPATGGGGPGPRPSAPAGGPKPPSSPTAPQPSAKDAPKIVTTPPKAATPAPATSAPKPSPADVPISPEAEKEMGRRQVEKFKARAAKAGDAPKITKTPSDSVPAKTSPPERAPRKNTIVLPPTIKNAPKTVKRDVRKLKKTAPAQEAAPKATPAPEPKPEAPKIVATPADKRVAHKKLTREERLAAHAEALKEYGRVPKGFFRKEGSVRDFALWAALLG